MSTTKPLFGPTLKISRANRHIRDLESLFDSFICDNPHRLRVDEDENGGFRLFAEFDRPIPNETAAIIGDVAHNLRAALDHLACDMIRKSGHEPTRYHGFPIYERKADFDGGITSKMNGASAEFVGFVKAQRPYRDCGGNAWLHDLSTLDNDDKHIVLTPAIGVVTVSNVSFALADGGIINFGQISVREEGHIELASIAGISGPPKLEANSEVAFAVEFDEGSTMKGADVIRMLSKLSGGVTKIVQEAAALFGADASMPQFARTHWPPDFLDGS